MRLVIHTGAAAFAGLRADWDELARRTPNPFLTHGWLSAWWSSFGTGELVVPALHDDAGRLLAAGAFERTPRRELRSAANVWSDDWDVVAADDAARAQLWRAIGTLRGPMLSALHLRAPGPSLPLAAQVLREAGFRPHLAEANASPVLALPASFDALMQSYSANMRSQLGRRRRALERRGAYVFRTVTGGPTLDADLEAFLRIEGSGWKSERGTAILSDERTAKLYLGAARALAGNGWLRLHLLELDGRLLAGDLAATIGDASFLIKTGFDVDESKASPGLVLRGEVLRAAIEEGAATYDFLGGPEPYKLRWGPELRPRQTLRTFQGAAGLGASAWWRALRPGLKRAKAELRDRRAAS